LKINNKKLFFLCTAVIASFIFWDGISVLVKQWLRMREYWRFLIIPVSVYFVWINRKELVELPVKPNLILGIPLTIAGCSAYILWKISFVDSLIEAGLFILTFGIIFMLLSTRFAKICFFPLFYLIFMTTILARILSPLSIFMQQVSAIFASFFLNTGGWSAIRFGRFLRLPNLILEVAPACSGVSQLIALIAFALPIGMLRHKSLLPRIILVLMTIPITLFSNAIRIVLIAIWNYKGLQTYIHGPHGILDLPLIYPLALICLYACSLILSLFEKKSLPVVSQTRLNMNYSDKKSISTHAEWYICFILMTITVIAAIFLKTQPVRYSHSLNEFPMHINQWNGGNFSDNIISFYMGKPDEIIQRKYFKDNVEISLTIARFDRQSTWKRIASIESHLFDGIAEPIEIPISPSEKINANEFETDIKNQNIFTIMWFDIDGGSYNSINSVRKQLIKNTIKKKHNNTAVITVSINNFDTIQDKKEVFSFIADVMPEIKYILSSL
jgi:exosortase